MSEPVIGTDINQLTNPEIGDLLIDVGALFYSLEVADDLQSAINTLIVAKIRLEQVRRERNRGRPVVAGPVMAVVTREKSSSGRR